MQLSMMLSGAEAVEFSKTILMLRKRTGAGYRSGYWVTYPSDQHGTGLLISEGSTEKGIWLYFPVPKKMIPVATRGFPALGSDFSCEDLLVQFPTEDYDFRALGIEEVDGMKLQKVEMRPKTSWLRGQLGFVKSVGWVRTDVNMIVRADFFDEDRLVRRFRADDIENSDGFWTARTLTMENTRIKHKTVVKITNLRYDIQIEDELLSPESFGKFAIGR
jgi:hypothetical protein